MTTLMIVYVPAALAELCIVLAHHKTHWLMCQDCILYNFKISNLCKVVHVVVLYIKHLLNFFSITECSLTCI